MAIFQPRFAIRAANAILHDAPVAASYFITNRCNFKCEFCEYPTFNVDRKQELSPSELDDVCKKLARVGVVMIAVIGGEPFVRKDIFDVVRTMSKHMMVQITTNGWFVDDEVAKKIFEAGAYMVNVSLDSARAEVHDSGRKQKGAYDRALAAVKALRDAPKIAPDQLAGFESILSGRNYDEVEAMVRIAQELGVRIVFQPYSGGHVQGSLTQLSSLSEVTGDPTARFRDLRKKYSALYNSHAMIDRFTPYFREGSIPDCQAGRTYFNIDTYGNITRCEEQRKTYGNLKELTVEGIRAALRDIRRDTKADGCDTCYLRTRGETEPLYEGDPKQFVRAAEDMFGLSLPRVLPRVLAVPGVMRALRTGLGAAARVGVVR